MQHSHCICCPDCGVGTYNKVEFTFIMSLVNLFSSWRGNYLSFIFACLIHPRCDVSAMVRVKERLP